MFGRNGIEQERFIEEQLFDAKQALFAATTVREVKFIQNKIEYLREQAKKLGK
jgi:hypothetical protein